MDTTRFKPTPRRAYSAVILLLALFLAYTLAVKPWLQTDLTALLPQEQQPDAVLVAADKAAGQQLESQVVLLAGSPDAEKAFQAAEEIASLWTQSGVFEEVESRTAPDLAALRGEIADLGLATLPQAQRTMLFEEPEAYFRTRAEAAVNLFADPSPVPLEQDWLGFGRFVPEKANPYGRLQWHAGNGMLYSETEDGMTWVWLRARLPEAGRLDDKGKLLPLLAQSRALAAENGADVLAAGGALFAAASKAGAERESRIMSTAGLLLTFTLLLWVFRSLRVFWLLLPLAAGLAAGLAAVLLVFGEVHVLTLVVGTSLVGMLVDFPLHWLAPSVFAPSEKTRAAVWQAAPAMKQVLPTFAVSLAVTAAGYALLWFTPLPVLRQTAVFSGFALLGAFGATVWWLPPLFARYRAREVPFAVYTGKLYHAAGRLKNRVLQRRGWLAAAALLAAFGLWRSDWHDDIRQWADMPSEMLVEARQIAVIGGMDTGGQYWVVEAENEDGLLRRSAAVSHALQPLVEAGRLGGFQSLDRFILPQDDQQKLAKRLRELVRLPETWRPLTDIGIPAQTVRKALAQAAERQPLPLSDGLKPQLAEAWRGLYLGEVEKGRFAAVVRLYGIGDSAAVQAAAGHLGGVHWADKRARLNESFRHTRNQAAWLKLASYALALGLLGCVFGLKRGAKILAVPLASAVLSVAVLGLAGIPVSLFAMFGLLLGSAVGIDYAVYAAAAKHSAPARLGGMLLAALTTGISFSLLAWSSTPAVAAFGITVTLGVAFNLVLAAGLLKDKNEKPRRKAAAKPIGR
ncbi:MMPL family transporter [Bergeriella denitrificans]|uniref:Predicted exporter n=1 Tax=Bergeriella denitrificans TaxID=494 RepID=A0A378UGS1_BERDE|nr:MMPL family transporter [Bergeriella denitrificans]STZ75711.1 Predicted exporter [Bergeriella denitrificans]